MSTRVTRVRVVTPSFDQFFLFGREKNLRGVGVLTIVLIAVAIDEDDEGHEMITVAFAPALTSSPLVVAFSCRAATSSSMSEATIPTTSLSSTSSPETIFEEFVQFILEHQSSMIHELEQIDGSGASFSLDGWEASCRSYL